jgi:hypothetical protein
MSALTKANVVWKVVMGFLKSSSSIDLLAFLRKAEIALIQA